MNKLSNKKLLSVVFILLLLTLIAKLIGVVLWWFLPSSGVEYVQSKRFTMEYKRIDFHAMLEGFAGVNNHHNETHYSINNFLLKGIFGSQHHGYAIIAPKDGSKQTYIVSVGESFEGYKLKELAKDFVLLEKNGREYTLKVIDSAPKYMQDATQERVESPEGIQEVSRKDITFYTKNPKALWRDIGIVEVYKNSRITGFRVTKVKKGSKMAMLGLKRGDIIIKANNVELTSYKNVFDIYNHINKIDAIDLVVLRNNQEVELSYEIR